MALGPVMFDIVGTELTIDDKRKLLHPMAGGVILFTRNFSSLNQLTELTTEIHSLRSPSLLIAVDHEGGKVQRFQNDFTKLPAMCELGKIWDEFPDRASYLAQLTGYVLAAELRAGGVDLSFTPVLDIDHGHSDIIGSRAFHRKPKAVWELAHSLMQGLKLGGMEAIGKHFPGHGYIQEDSHIEIPVDNRSYTDIETDDLIPFQKMINYGLAGIMPAHVIYPKIDLQPAGFSAVWLQEILRGQLGFEGCIFSDDLSMKGATVAGDIVQRAEIAFNAGCDMVLVCNDYSATDKLLSELQWNMPVASHIRLDCMRAKPNPDTVDKLYKNAGFIKAVHEVKSIGTSKK
ncbi:MAG: beta-N-acetylhexosaminidase [Nitrosomonadaceae bacterium]|nr:beta-N-acetylhexosaminidase [Nitrosomonadaceae bacterium]|tara:strand:+ start:574 stop:1608 length:1035 start_codon:yes stop_codon:yes gene_type:complete